MIPYTIEYEDLHSKMGSFFSNFASVACDCRCYYVTFFIKMWFYLVKCGKMWWGEWPSGLYSLCQMTEVKLGQVR